jgi:hypothetical protein
MPFKDAVPESSTLETSRHECQQSAQEAVRTSKSYNWLSSSPSTSTDQPPSRVNRSSTTSLPSKAAASSWSSASSPLWTLLAFLLGLSLPSTTTLESCCFQRGVSAANRRLAAQQSNSHRTNAVRLFHTAGNSHAKNIEAGYPTNLLLQVKWTV